MSFNLGFFVSKFIRWINRPALRDCRIDKTAKVGSGSNCIGTSIGRYSYMGKNNSIINTHIGSFCSIASYCSIGGSGHDLHKVSTSPVFYQGRNVFNKHFSSIELNPPKDVVIGNDVWIGEGVFIKEGITIGNGAVIGAHSVVTHNIPSYAIAAGIPAKVLHYRFSEEIIHALEESRWWEWSESRLIDDGYMFSSADYFLR